ncbi:patatin family protein [Alkalilimnicola ehrlichii]|uniref:patatin family protein n=1 Tax=Alkalilimnicola ehrlichii TaxID=351052 RepID=UPI002162865E|nr:patatin family protein [Alkalilimnicola ehrlichii]
MTSTNHQTKIGIALGSGSARGWSHIGVLTALAEAGIEPDIVCGSSIGALIGGVYAAGRLDDIEAWGNSLTRREVFSYMDFTLSGGGAIAGKRLMEVCSEYIEGCDIECLPKRFGAVATDLKTGTEVWLQEGPLQTAIRASISLPGLLTPVHVDGRWLVDGGLVNPVPVSLCRALGADIVIAVNLNGDLLGRLRRQPAVAREPAARLSRPRNWKWRTRRELARPFGPKPQNASWLVERCGQGGTADGARLL